MNPIEALKMHGVGVGNGDAQSADVRAGKTFSNAQGNNKVGTLAVRSTVAQTITPGQSNVVKYAGIYDGDITIEGDPDLVAANIVSGKSIFGVAGSLTGKRWASGTQTFTYVSGTHTLRITGVAFRPTFVLATFDLTGAQNFILWESVVYSLYGSNPQEYTRGGTSANPGTLNQAITDDGFTFDYQFTGGTIRWLVYG